MNQRIKQLAVEAGMIVGEPNGFDMTRLMPKEVKFAELIVRECAEQVKNLHVNDYGISGAEIIREHFGVEE